MADEMDMTTDTAEQAGASSPEPVAAPSCDSALDALRLSVEAGFAGVLQAFEQKLAYDSFKEEQVSRLHAELVHYKTNLLAQATRPFVQGIIRLHDDTDKMITALKRLDPAELTPERMFKALDGLQEDLELVLSQNGVEAFREQGNHFDPRRQKAVKTAPTPDSAAAGQVVERLHPGFEQDGVILQKERVAVSQYVAPPRANDGIQDQVEKGE